MYVRRTIVQMADTWRGRRARLVLAAGLTLGLAFASVGAATADASLGELSFLGCLGQLGGCATLPAGLTGAVEDPKGLVVSPDGANVYAADEGSSAIDVFSRNLLTGTLTLTGCVGEHAGCQPTTPEKAVERPFSVVVSPDGANVYAASVGSNAIDEFARNASTGALTYLGCIGQLSGCTHTPSAEQVTAPLTIVISADGANVYIAGGAAVTTFSRNAATGLLAFEGCQGNEVPACQTVGPTGSFHAAGGLAISPDGHNVYVGAQVGTISTFTRDTATGALTYDRCLGYFPACPHPSTMFAINEPLSLVVSPDGANLYAGNFNNDVVDVLAREVATGALTYLGCNGHFTEEPAACAAPPEGAEPVPDGPLQIAVSPDGADLYVASDYSVSEFSRGSGGALSYVGCTGQVAGICTATNPSEAVFFQISLALSPNGASLYSGDELSHDIDEFGRVTFPICSAISANVAYQTQTPLTLTCSDADGKPVSFSITSSPTHGSLGSVSASGQVTYTPAAGFSGPDSFTFTAQNADGTAVAATATITVGQPAGSTVTTQTHSLPGGGGTSPTTGIATTPKAVEEVLLACTKRPLVLSDVLVRGDRVLLEGSAAESLHGKKVKIIFDGHVHAATATIAADGEFSTTAPLPSVRLRDSNSARYQAESGSQRSLDLKLTRRLTLEPPTFSAGTVTLVGQVLPPLRKPATEITVEQELECGSTTIVGRFKPSASGRFHITLKVPAIAKAGLYRLQSSVAEKPGSKHGFSTYSLPLPVILG